MPIITFIKDMVAMAKGSYYYRIARHTQLFCQRAHVQAVNGRQRRMFFVAAAAADETMGRLLRLRPDAAGAGYRPRKFRSPVKQSALFALKIYLSALLVLLGTQRQDVLANTELDEPQLLNKWCSVFEYTMPDKEVFNQILLPAFQQGGIEALAKAAGTCITGRLSCASQPLEADELKAMEHALTYDLAAVLRNIKIHEAG